VGTPVVLLGRGILAEEHARVAGTINYELVCGISSSPQRARRMVVDG
jgi:alanine racemase